MVLVGGNRSCGYRSNMVVGLFWKKRILKSDPQKKDPELRKGLFLLHMNQLDLIITNIC